MNSVWPILADSYSKADYSSVCQRSSKPNAVRSWFVISKLAILYNYCYTILSPTGLQHLL